MADSDDDTVGVGLRRRHPGGEQDGRDTATISASSQQEVDKVVSNKPSSMVALSAGSYWLTRIVFIRSLGFVYCE